MSTAPKRKSSKQLQKIVDDFNRNHPVGWPVFLRTDNGWIETRVTDPAQVLGGHSAVAWFERISGCYSIENGRVRHGACTKPVDLKREGTP